MIDFVFLGVFRKISNARMSINKNALVVKGLIVFKKINLSSDLYLNLKNIDYFSNSQRIENLNEMKNLFNNSSLKQFAFYLTLNIGLDNETNLLKKYLRKFKRNYKCYFFYQNGTYVNLPTDKEINLYAIDSLFLLTGI